MSRPVVPPGWPEEVRPPDTPDWERTATAWLFDLCPPDYRRHEVLLRHPVVLARFAAHHVHSGVEAARRGLATVRDELRDVADPETVTAAYDAMKGLKRVLATEVLSSLGASLKFSDNDGD